MRLYLAARTPQEVDTIKIQEVININIQQETILEEHALRHEPNDLSAGHTLQQEPMYASRYKPNDLSSGYASQQDPVSSDTSNLISLNGIPETVPEGHVSLYEPRGTRKQKDIRK